MEMVNNLKQQINVHPKMLNSLKGDHTIIIQCIDTFLKMLPLQRQ